MKKVFTAVALSLLAGTAYAQTAGSSASSQTRSDSGAFAANGDITFEAADPLHSQRVHTTPNVYAPPSMFGGANNCGQSSTMGVGMTGFGIGGSVASESDACNAREDTGIAAKLGYMDVAKLRFFCFGEQANRMAYEAAGYSCPSSGTAKGIEGAPVGPKITVAPSVPQTIHGRVNADGTVTYKSLN